MNLDVLIHGARIIDGTGNPWFYGDIGIAGEKIAAVAPPGHLPRNTAGEVVDATGLVVCPGFIDIQSHSLQGFFKDGRSVSKVTQGVTTEIMGESWSPMPFGGRRRGPFSSSASPELEEEARTWKSFSDWLKAYTKRGVSVNVGSYVGGSTIREYACGWDIGDPSAEQLDLMKQIMAEAMQDGAFGIAPALIYPPSSYATDHELTELGRVVGRHGGTYIVHMRSEAGKFLEALDATLQLSRDAEVGLEIYHLKASGKGNWHKMPIAIEKIEQARARGIDVTADMYPYIASGTGLSVVVPDWAFEGGKLYDRLRDPATREKIYGEMRQAKEGVSGDFGGSDRSGSHIMTIGYNKPENKQYVGKRLSEIAEMRGQDWANAAIDLLASEGQRIFSVFFTMSEDNVKLQLKQPWVKISTDAGGSDPARGGGGPVHPRGYGTYPRVLGKYVREEKVLSLEEAVRKMSGAVAQRLSLRDRGLLREGMQADVVVFNPDTIIDKADFGVPPELSVGVRDVWVNGGRVVKDNTHTGATPGQAVYGAGRR